jgi:hypothetical protein
MTRASLVLAALLFAVPTFAQTTVAGDWELTIQSPTGTRSVPLTLKQEGETITGMFKGPQGELPVKGTLIGDELKFDFSIPIQGSSIDISMNGKVANDAVSGTAQFGGFGEGPFTMKRPDKAAATSTTTPPTPANPGAATPTTTDPPVPAGLAGGKWDVTIKTPGGDFPAVANFTEDAGKLSGTFSGQMGEVPVTGTIEGKALKLSMVAKTPQGDITVELSGDVDGDSIVNGKADIAGMGQMEWTAKRAKQ